MMRAATMKKVKEYVPTEQELEEFRQRFRVYEVIMSEEESKIFDEIQRRHWEDTLKYEQTHKKQKRI